MKPVLLQSLRYPRAWFFLGLLIAAGVTIASLVPPEDLPSLRVSDKLEHAVAYVLLGFWFASVIARWDYVYLILALLALGGGIEIAQGLMGLGRQADWHDLLADACGILVGVGLAATPLGRWANFIEDRLTRRGR
ncbi:MAG: VanZ family protein [Pseudomonadota bacterium]